MSVTEPMNIGVEVSLSKMIYTKGLSSVTSFISSGYIEASALTATEVTAPAFVPRSSTSICVLCKTSLI